MNAWAPGPGWIASAAAMLLAPLLAGAAHHIARAYHVNVRLTTAAAFGGAATASAALLAPTPALLAASVVLLWPLTALGLIDCRCQRLPDPLTLPLLLAGLLQAALMAPEALADRAIGAAAGYGVLRLAAWLYRRTRGRDGLGLGDAKLLAAGGAWLGWTALPIVLFVASVAGLAWAAGLAARGRAISATTPLAFGAFLALAIWLTWLWRMAAPLGLRG